MAKKSPQQDHSSSLASGAIESLTMNLLAILLEKGAINRQEADKLIAGMKNDLRAFRGGPEGAGAEALVQRLNEVARRFGVTKPN
jgi:hypothetical protein